MKLERLIIAMLVVFGLTACGKEDSVFPSGGEIIGGKSSVLNLLMELPQEETLTVKTRGTITTRDTRTGHGVATIRHSLKHFYAAIINKNDEIVFGKAMGLLNNDGIKDLGNGRYQVRIEIPNGIASKLEDDIYLKISMNNYKNIDLEGVPISQIQPPLWSALTEGQPKGNLDWGYNIPYFCTKTPLIKSDVLNEYTTEEAVKLSAAAARLEVNNIPAFDTKTIENIQLVFVSPINYSTVYGQKENERVKRLEDIFVSGTDGLSQLHPNYLGCGAYSYTNSDIFYNKIKYPNLLDIGGNSIYGYYKVEDKKEYVFGSNTSLYGALWNNISKETGLGTSTGTYISSITNHLFAGDDIMIYVGLFITKKNGENLLKYYTIASNLKYEANKQYHIDLEKSVNWNGLFGNDMINKGRNTPDPIKRAGGQTRSLEDDGSVVELMLY